MDRLHSIQVSVKVGGFGGFTADVMRNDLDDAEQGEPRIVLAHTREHDGAGPFRRPASTSFVLDVSKWVD